MAGRGTAGLILALACLFFLVTPKWSRSSGEDCRVVQQQRDARAADLALCVESLARAHAQEDLAGLGALSEKIGRLVEEIRELDARSECGRDGARSNHGLGQVKSDPGVFESKSCAELKQHQVKFLMTVNALKRRSRSKFSQLSSSEKEELDRAEGDLRTVKSLIGARCAQEKPPPLRQMLRNPGGSRDGLRR